MNLQAGQQAKTKIIMLSILSGIGFTLLSLAIGVVLDYIIVQILSQYFLADCSEDCYFAYFNAIFYVIALLSLVGGFMSGRRMYRRLAERSK